MAAIGLVSRTIEKGFAGQLRTLSIRVPIEIRLNASKSGDVQPDYRVWSDGVEISAGWLRRSDATGNLYVSLTLAAPEFGPRRIYANLGRAAGGRSASLRASATAALLNPTRSLSWRPHVRKLLSAELRVRMTVAAS